MTCPRGRLAIWIFSPLIGGALSRGQSILSKCKNPPSWNNLAFLCVVAIISCFSAKINKQIPNDNKEVIRELLRIRGSLEAVESHNHVTIPLVYKMVRRFLTLRESPRGPDCCRL